MEAANITSFQIQSSLGDDRSEPGQLIVHDDVPTWVQAELRRMDYRGETQPKTSVPTTAINFDREHGSCLGGASDYGEDLRHGLVAGLKLLPT